jgi:hypothetical protein
MESAFPELARLSLIPQANRTAWESFTRFEEVRQNRAWEGEALRIVSQGENQRWRMRFSSDFRGR